MPTVFPCQLELPFDVNRCRSSCHLQIRSEFHRFELFARKQNRRFCRAYRWQPEYRVLWFLLFPLQSALSYRQDLCVIITNGSYDRKYRIWKNGCIQSSSKSCLQNTIIYCFLWKNKHAHKKKHFKERKRLQTFFPRPSPYSLLHCTRRWLSLHRNIL